MDEKLEIVADGQFARPQNRHRLQITVREGQTNWEVSAFNRLGHLLRNFSQLQYKP